MGIDKQKFNTIYNQLKDLVGENGAFAIMVSTPTQGHGEDMKFEAVGAITKVTGMLGIGNQYLHEALQQKLDALLRPAPRQPD